MELTFRKLKPEEIEARIYGEPSAEGVKILLYKDARCDQRILDETVGVLGWQRHHSRNNANCVVSIWDKDKHMWIEKEDVGTSGNCERDKSLASDSFKRACVNFGIGRELYTSPNIFVRAKDLFALKQDGQKWICLDNFRVVALTHKGEGIETVTLEVSYQGNTRQLVFPYTETTPVAPKGVPAPAESAVSEPVATTPTTPSPKKTKLDQMFSNDEVILIGNCRGKKIGEVRGTEKFKSFLEWIKASKTKYDNSEAQAQYMRFKKLVG